MSLLKAYFNDNELLYDLDMVYPEFISTVRVSTSKYWYICK